MLLWCLACFFTEVFSSKGLYFFQTIKTLEASVAYVSQDPNRQHVASFIPPQHLPWVHRMRTIWLGSWLACTTASPLLSFYGPTKKVCFDLQCGATTAGVPCLPVLCRVIGDACVVVVLHLLGGKVRRGLSLPSPSLPCWYRGDAAP